VVAPNVPFLFLKVAVQVKVAMWLYNDKKMNKLWRRVF